MNKILKRSIFCIAILLIIGVLVYFIPWRTPIEFTLNAIKLDDQGTPIGTTQIHIKGYKLNYLFQDDRLELEIDPIDHIKNISLNGGNGNGKQAVIDCFGKEYLGTDYLRIRFDGWDIKSGTTAFGFMYFTEAFDCFAFECKTLQQNPVYYVASVNGSHSTSELIRYFNGLVPGQ